MPGSSTLTNFRQTLRVVRRLLVLERQYRDPPRPAEADAVRGLRGGAAVLMVAAFENFMRETFEEQVVRLGGRPPKVEFDKLPDRIRVAAVFRTLELAMGRPGFGRAGRRVDRLGDIDIACKLVVSKTVDPAAFTANRRNVSADMVKEMFKDIDISDVFKDIKNDFEKAWGKPEASTFIPDKLDEIANRRHVVAHTANTLNISRSELKESVRFLVTLAQVLGKRLRAKIRAVIRSV